jgi:branched-chain amino acid transport system ATP-binding protein
MLEKDGKQTKLNKMKPFMISKAGLARTFQNIRLFKNMSVLDNVRIAMHQNTKYGVFSGLLHTPAYQREEKKIREESKALLDIFKLGDKIGDMATNLPYGEQRRLEIVRALATKPVLLLLDEPAAGMNPAESAQLTDTIVQLRRDFNLTILLIEHDMSVVMKICERIYVMDYGKVIAQGTPDEIKTNKRVIEAYLGEDVANA